MTMTIFPPEPKQTYYDTHFTTIRFGGKQAARMNKARTHKGDARPVEDPEQGSRLTPVSRRNRSGC